MRPLRRALLTLAVVAAVGIVYFALRLATVDGVFGSYPQVSPGACREIARGVRGPEDMEVDAAHNVLLISSGLRHGAAPDYDPRDGIYMLKLDALTAPAVKLASGLRDFHPHGINLYHAPDGTETLLAVNHRASGRQAVELFSLSYEGGVPRLVQQSTIEGGLLVSPNDLAAYAPGRFYVANDHGTRGALGRFAEDWLLLPLANLLDFNGQSLGVAVSRIAFANGVLATPDGHFVYVTSFNDRRLLAFRREPFLGSLTEIGALAIPAKLDNISMDAGGNLIIAGRGKPAGAQVFRVTRGKDGVPTGYETIFSDDGRRITRASSGVVWNRHLFIGSSRDDKVLDCAIE